MKLKKLLSSALAMIILVMLLPMAPVFAASGLTGPLRGTLNRDGYWWLNINYKVNTAVELTGTATYNRGLRNYASGSEVDHTDGKLFTVQSGGTLIVSGSVVISGNYETADSPMIEVENGGKLILKDTATLTNGRMTRGNYPGGGAVLVRSGGTFEMQGGTISNCYATKGGAVYVESGGTFNMTGGTITGCSAGQTGGGGIYAASGSTCILSNATVKDCSSSGVITAGNFKMTGNTEVKNNTAGLFGAGISIIGGTAQILSGTKITGNKGEYGAGLAVSGGATLTANGLTISSGQPVYRDCSGGGLFMGDSTVVLKNCNISSNTVTNGGGVYMEGGSLTVEDCEISGNTVTGNGGGICIKGGSYENKNTTIKTNSASNGGGVYMLNGSFTMTSGSITENSATTANSSGVSIDKTMPSDMAYFYQNGGSITENNNGGLLIDVYSIYYNKPAESVIISGSGSIDNNTGSNVYIANEDSILTIGGALSGIYKVQAQTAPAAGELLPIAVANDGYTITASDLSKIAAQSDSESVVLNDNKLGLMSATDIAAPTITTDLSARADGYTGDDLTLSVSATGQQFSTLTYQWYKDGNIIEGAINASYTITSTRTSDSGNYHVKVTSNFGKLIKSQDSRVCAVSFSDPVAPVPQFESSLDDGKTIYTDDSVTFSASATPPAMGSLSYQWYKNNVAIPGATTNSYAVTGAQITDTGVYKLVVTNTFKGAAATAYIECSLTVIDPVAEMPSFTTNLNESATGFVGDDFTFSALATTSDGGTVSYQWYKDGKIISGETNSTYAINSAEASDSGTYSVVATNKFRTSTKSNTSRICVLIVKELKNPVIKKDLESSKSVMIGSAVSFAIETEAVETGVSVTYQWYKNDVAISGATSATYTINATASTDIANYKVIVTNKAGGETLSVTSTICALDLVEKPSWTDDGNYDISWYNANDVEYAISTAAELAGVAKLASSFGVNFSNKIVTLENDIDISGLSINSTDGLTWTPTSTFNGVFDGNGHQIKNLTIFDTIDKGGQYIGFIASLNGTVKNLTLADVNIEKNVNGYAYNYYAVGGIAGAMYGDSVIDNCFVTGAVETTLPGGISAYTGGICGYAIPESRFSVGIIKNCGNHADVTTSRQNFQIAAGILGNTDFITVKNCYNIGTVFDGIIGLKGADNWDENNCNAGSSSYGLLEYSSSGYMTCNYFLQTDTINNGIPWIRYQYGSTTPEENGTFDQTGNITLLDSSKTIYGGKTKVQDALNAWVDDHNEDGYRTWEFVDNYKPAFGAYRKIDVTVSMSTPERWFATDTGKSVSAQARKASNNAIPSSDYSIWYEGDGYAKSKSIPQATGEYTATFELKNASSDMYQITDGSTTQVNFTISKADNTFDILCYDYTYNGNAPQPVIKQNISGGSVTCEYKPYGADDSQYSSAAPANTGKYTLRATSAETEQYNSASKTVDFTIYGLDNDLDVIIANQLYGKPITPQVLKNKSGGALTYQYKKKTENDSAYTNAIPQTSGDYIAKVTSARTENYNETTVYVEFSISKLESTLKITCGDVIYGDSVNPTVITNTSGGAVSFAYKPASAPDSEYSTIVPTSAGKYIIKATSQATDNYYVQTSTEAFTISKRMLTLTNISAEDREYNGKADVTVNAQLQNAVSGDHVSIDVFKAGMSDKNVGADKAVTVTALSLKGSDAQNYELQSPSNITVNISRKSINTNLSAIDRAYNGTTLISYSGGLNEEDIVAGDDVRLTDLTLSVEDANASETAKSVTINAMLTGDDSENYELIPQTNLSVVISKVVRQAPELTKTDVQTENGFGSISGLTTDMEYQVYGAETWQDCLSASIENLEPDFYSVRYKGSNNYSVSDSTDVFILEYAAPASYNVSGCVFDENGEPIEHGEICLIQGKTQIAPTRKPVYTNTFGMFTLVNVPSGIYNLVITKDGNSKMVICMVGDEDLDTGKIILNSANLNSKIEMQDDNGWYVVDGLNELFDANDINNATGDGNAVEHKFTAKTIIDDEEKALLSIPNWNMTDCYDLNLYKTVTRNSVIETPQELTELSSLITVYIPLSETLRSKNNILAGRIHNGRIEQLATRPNDDGEYIEIMDDVIAIHTMKFSKYAIYYKTSSSGGGSYVSAPSVNHASGEIAKNSLIILDSSISDANIYYTLDGSVPTITSTLYTQPIIAKEDMVIKFIAAVNGRKSSVLTRQYKVRNLNAEIMAKANEARYIKGYDDNTFKPDNDISRYEMINSLYNIIDFESTSLANVFSDVSAEYEKDVNAFVSAGIINGFEDGSFKGEQGLTRAEFVKIMSIILKLSVNNSTDKFTDTQGHWAQEYIAEFTKLGYLKGYEDGSFKPDQKMTRAEFVTIVNRIIQKNGVSVPPVFSDLSSGHWAYSNIMAAYSK